MLGIGSQIGNCSSLILGQVPPTNRIVGDLGFDGNTRQEENNRNDIYRQKISMK